eukprot:scaffold11522_cov239-Ochromonas_danica.AAC.5
MKEGCLRLMWGLIFFHLLLHKPVKDVESDKTSSQSIMVRTGFTTRIEKVKRNTKNLMGGPRKGCVD